VVHHTERMLVETKGKTCFFTYLEGAVGPRICAREVVVQVEVVEVEEAKQVS